MSKQIVGNGNSSYTFDAASKTVTFNGIDNLKIWQILIVVNLTRENIMYNPYVTGYGYTNFSNNILTLEFDTTAYSNTDVLQIFYDNSNSEEASISDLSMEIKDLIKVISNPAFVDSVGGIKISSGILNTLSTVTTVQTVAAVTTLTQVNGVSTNIAISDPLLNIAFQNIRSQLITT